MEYAMRERSKRFLEIIKYVFEVTLALPFLFLQIIFMFFSVFFGLLEDVSKTICDFFLKDR